MTWGRYLLASYAVTLGFAFGACLPWMYVLSDGDWSKAWTSTGSYVIAMFFCFGVLSLIRFPPTARR